MPPVTRLVPVEEDAVTGQSVIPLSRIKKIIDVDENIEAISKNAVFTIAMATEMFIQCLAEQGYNVMKSERKPRKTMQYKDLATAVSRIEDLEFLLDVIPKTTTYKQFKEKRAREAAQETELEKGQQTLNGTSAATENGVNRTPGGQSLLQSQLNNGDGHPPAEAPTPTLPTVAMMVDRTVETTPPTNGDVEMSE